MDLNYFRLCLFLGTIFSLTIAKPSPTQPKTEKNFSFAIPAFLLGGGGGIGGNVNPNAVNNGNLPNINSITNTNQLNQNTNLNFGTNLFRQATVTRTILSTVATVTAPVFRTCTVTPANFAQTPCAAGRRKRSVDGVFEEEASAADSLEMVLVMGSTTVTDQAMASVMLHLDHNLNKEITSKTQNVHSSIPAPASSATTLKIRDFVPLFPSEDMATTVPDGDELAGTDDDASQDLKAASATPGLSNVAHISGEVNDLVHHARINLGGTVTVTRTLPVTAVINSTVTAGGMNAMLQALTISYVGCSPPILPVTGTPC